MARRLAPVGFSRRHGPSFPPPVGTSCPSVRQTPKFHAPNNALQRTASLAVHSFSVSHVLHRQPPSLSLSSLGRLLIPPMKTLQLHHWLRPAVLLGIHIGEPDCGKVALRMFGLEIPATRHPPRARRPWTMYRASTPTAIGTTTKPDGARHRWPANQYIYWHCGASVLSERGESPVPETSPSASPSTHLNLPGTENFGLSLGPYRRLRALWHDHPSSSSIMSLLLAGFRGPAHSGGHYIRRSTI